MEPREAKRIYRLALIFVSAWVLSELVPLFSLLGAGLGSASSEKHEKSEADRLSDPCASFVGGLFFSFAVFAFAAAVGGGIGAVGSIARRSCSALEDRRGMGDPSSRGSRRGAVGDGMESDPFQVRRV